MNIVLSGPSGSGKGTITEMLMNKMEYRKFTTCTTRPSRENEKNGFDYYFLSKEEFDNYVKNGVMYNIREYGGNLYGSFEKNMDNIESNVPVIFQLTPDRALKMKEVNPNTFLILILPPNVEELKNRRKDRTVKRVEDDIKNLEDAMNYDFVVINDDLELAVTQIIEAINAFETKSFSVNSVQNQKIIKDFIKQFNNASLESKVEKVFNKKIADSWDDKARFVTYHGIKNPITNEVLSSIHNGMSIADIGCGTGKLISKIDRKIDNSVLTGLDISSNMIYHAQNRVMTEKNKTVFINDDFMKYDFKNKFDIIIFSYVLHHMSDPVEALRRAKELLTNEGNILFSVPGTSYLSETFKANELNGRYSIEEMDQIVAEAGLYPLSACRNNFLMSFNSYEMYIEYLKSIGTYQKINNYLNEEWDSEFNKVVLERFNASEFITGEYLTYNCKDKKKILTRS